MTVFDASNPYEMVKIASLPVDESNDLQFATACLCFDRATNLIRVTQNSVGGSGNVGYLKELKSTSIIDCGHLTEIPSFVKKRSLPQNIDSVAAMHI